MKTLFILLLFIPSIAFSQGYGEDKNGISGQQAEITINKPLKNRMDSIQFQINYMRFCIGKFNSQHNTAIVLICSGTILPVIGLFVNNNDTKKILIISGPIILFIGEILNIDSYKWLQRASISPFPEGITFKINF